ncbi:MAG: DUF6069 family protein [Rhodoglobus sp.]
MTEQVTEQVTERRTPRRPLIVIGTVIVSVVVNLIIYAVGRAAGGDFRFTNGGASMEVDALTVVGFTIVPLILGMTAAALLSLKWRWVTAVALVVGPALALGSIAVMTLPTDFDAASKATLALCHVALVPVMVTGLLALRRA